MEEDSSCRKQEEKVKEEAGDSDKHSSFQMMTSKRGSGGSGGAASDDALDGLPAFEPEEDENWHYALPLGTAGDAAKANSKTSQCTQDNTSTKKDCFPRKPGEDEEGEQEREASQVSANTSHSSQDNTPDNSRETAPVEDGNTPASPGITIKDEPVDEGYDAALLPQSSTKQIKEELDQQEEELRISSVYSVGGANTFTSNTSEHSILFVMGFKVLLKGQTAFQRKGSTQLFCSTVCLTGHLPPHISATILWILEIAQPRDMITIPAEDNTLMSFCGQFCLSVFRHRKKTIDRIPDKCESHLFLSFVFSLFLMRLPPQQIEHEVTHQGRLHRLCSDACFVTWRKLRQLSMNCCEGCGLYCNSNSGSSNTLSIERSHLNFCSPTCIGTYIHVRNGHLFPKIFSPGLLVSAPFPCSLCKVSAVPQYHLALLDGTIRNFCSYNCGSFAVASSVPPIPQDHSSLVPFPGHHPSHSSVPPLVPPPSAMSSTILPGQTQAISSSAQLPKLAEGGRKDAIKLTCNQCNKHFNTKPLLFSHQGHISLLCSVACSEKYKIEKNILALCDGCKQEKGLFDTITYNQEELFFCSENCKVLFKHNLTLRNKDHTWHSCSYCSGFSSKMLHSHYGGKIEQFCKPHCMSQYTVLHYGMSRCDSCRKQGYLTEMLQCLGSVRNFCNMSCLLHYCFLYFEMSQHANSNGTGTAAQTPCSKSHDTLFFSKLPFSCCSKFRGNSLPTSNIDGRNLDHASTQTDATRPPAHRRRQMKNKSVLCRPFTVDQEIMCQLPEAYVEKVKVVMFPVPVPVYIPVPVNVYSQDMPVPVVIPIPLPIFECFSNISAPHIHCLSIQGRKRAASAESSALAAPATSTINHLYGLKAWKNWVHQCRQQPQESCSLDFKEDILQYDSTELSFALSRFIKELRRPNGDTYSPDSIFYLCLGIQQYIFLKGRIENIFTDELYGQFASEISAMLQLWKPKLLPNGGVVPSRVEESFLWECKQLGAYSPIVLLNTLLFFCTKKFHLTTVEQHRHLSFSNFTRRSKPCNRAGKVCYLHYRNVQEKKRKDIPAKQEEEDLEMLENVTYPLHCPVRLYEFYLSRCPESVRDRTDVFYLQPEKNVCHWYSPQPLDAAILQTMLTRILAVREVQQELEAARHRCSTDGDAE
uniref:TRASH domain-containing protein n=1 Tax=Oryzias latipes TaxID=8090 RepID=H2MTV1_ORYLA